MIQIVKFAKAASWASESAQDGVMDVTTEIVELFQANYFRYSQSRHVIGWNRDKTS
jgi:hypothetical protein